MDTFNLVKEYSDRIINDRDIWSIYDYGILEEGTELAVELDARSEGTPPGPDGVIGEAIDVISCMMDLIIKDDPSMTSERFHELLDKKLQKWERKYHQPE